MEDKQIIELFWEHSENAIKETEEKYGAFCAYIANNILRNKEDSAKCVEESYAQLVDTIPPRRPKNLKAYLAKITRYHALYIWEKHKNPENENLVSVLAEVKECIPESENETQMTEEYVIELTFEAFLKELEQVQYQLFIARYWYMASISEISSKYKMNDVKIEKILSQLRQKFKAFFEKEKVSSVDAQNILYAMTEIEDRYLDEVSFFDISDTKSNENVEEEANENTLENRVRIPHLRFKNKKLVVVVATALVLVLVVFLLPKERVGQGQLAVGSEEGGGEIATESDGGELLPTTPELISFIGPQEEFINEADFSLQMSNLPWNDSMQIAALPVYKNLSWYNAQKHAEFLNEETLLSMVQDIASKLDMQVISTRFDRAEDENGSYISGIEAITDLGSIQIEDDGYVKVTFLEGVKLPDMHVMSDDASTQRANETVLYLLDAYSDILPAESWQAVSYASYDADENRKMNYRAAAYSFGLDGILDYYFCQVNFEYSEEYGLTAINYRDYRTAAEFIEYRPVISLETATMFLKEGAYESEAKLSDVQDVMSGEILIAYVELMYKTGYREAYYEPYYCFYGRTSLDNMYAKFYVPATTEEAEVDLLYPSGTEPEEQSKVTILNMEEYNRLDEFVYYENDKCWGFADGAIKELAEVPEIKSEGTYGSLMTLETENGWKTIFCYEDTELNMTELLKDVHYDSLYVQYIDGKILIQCVSSSNKYYVSYYIYSLEDKTLKLTVEESLYYQINTQVNGIKFYGERYATRVEANNDLMFIDLFDGTEVNSYINYADIKQVLHAGDKYVAIVYNTGEIAIVDATNGEIVEKTQYQIQFGASSILYEDGWIYIETWEGKNFVFVIPL